MMTFSCIKVVFAFSVVAAYAQVLPAPTVTLTEGVVIGTAVPGVNKFLGIPYAAPPVRFRLAQPPAVRTVPLVATTLKPSCPQTRIDNATLDAVFITPGETLPIPESEDCLYVNVFAPSTGLPGKAVMFWIYGGNLNFGSGSVPFYDGTSFAANQDVVLVTFNYRTNVFGSPIAPAIPLEEKNVGLRDQRLALNWVYNNIARFGGDPNKITIFGESAGGFSAKQMLIYPTGVPVAAAILQSPGIGLTFSGEANWKILAGSFGCASIIPAQELACMQRPNITFRDITANIYRLNITFSPVFDDRTLARNSAPSIVAKTFAHVPVLIGSNSQEAQVAVAAGLISNFAAQGTTDAIFTCPVAQLAFTLHYNSYRVWRYYFQGVFPNTQPLPNSGAYHSSEVPIVFGTYPPAGATPAEISLSRKMQTTWANFAKNPSALSPLPWPQYDSFVISTQDTQSFGGIDSDVEATIYHSTIDRFCFLHPLTGFLV